MLGGRKIGLMDCLENQDFPPVILFAPYAYGPRVLAVSLSCQCRSEHFGRTIHSYPIPFPGETLSGFGAQIRTFLFGQTISQAAAAADMMMK